MKNREGNGRKYLEKKIIFVLEEKKKRKIFGEGKYFFVEEKNNGEGKEGKYSENQDTFRILDA